MVAIVEDDNLLSLVLKKQLELEGISSVIFSRAEEFLNYLQSSPNLIVVLMDVKLKGEMSGLTLATHVPKKIPIIFCTGNSDIDLSGLPHPSQVMDVLVKPIDIDQLIKMIRPLNP